MSEQKLKEYLTDNECEDSILFENPDYFYEKIKSTILPYMILFESDYDDVTKELHIWFNSEIQYRFDWKFNINVSYDENLLALIKELEEYEQYVNNYLKFDNNFKEEDVFGYTDTVSEKIPLVIEKLKNITF